MRRRGYDNALQLSLFDDYREKSDNQLISELTNKADMVSDAWEGGYRLEKLFNSLTPQRRRIAMAAVELYKRREVRKGRAEVIRRSEDIYGEMRPLMADLPNEEFWVIALNRANKVMEKQRIFVGGIDQTAVDVRLVMRRLIELGASGFVAVHNHPSGNLRPSTADRNITDVLKNAGNLFNICMVDHVIVSDSGYYSFNDEGLL